MGLHAVVFCNCYETGQLASAPPDGCRIRVQADGSLECITDDPEIESAFDAWLEGKACAHEDGVLQRRYLGNVDSIALLRAKLYETPTRFPMILSRVIYNATHAGDFMPYPDVVLLRPDVAALSETHSDDARTEKELRTFETSLRDLIDASMSVRKPIVF